MASLHARLQISIEHQQVGNQRSYQLKKRGAAVAVELPSQQEEPIHGANEQGTKQALDNGMYKCL